MEKRSAVKKRSAVRLSNHNKDLKKALGFNPKKEN